MGSLSLRMAPGNCSGSYSTSLHLGRYGVKVKLKAQLGGRDDVLYLESRLYGHLSAFCSFFHGQPPETFLNGQKYLKREGI